MKRTLIQPDFSQFPAAFQPLLEKTPVYDSSCSAAARVWFLDTGGGLFLKSAPAGSLKDEGEMSRFFHGKGLGPEVLHYESGEKDWLLTRGIPGEDCLAPQYLDDPRRLCDTLSSCLRMLHDTDPQGCPVTDCCERYLAKATENRRAGRFDKSLFPGEWGFSSAEEAWAWVEANASGLTSSILVHGDYCLPNVLLRDWEFSGFIDLGMAGLGDRHFDVFWGLWTLNYNLKTNAFYDRFLDGYGRERIEPELLRTVAALECFFE